MIGACHRIPGVHYLEFEEFGDDMPGPHQYDTYCRSCWGNEQQDEEAELESDSDGGGGP